MNMSHPANYPRTAGIRPESRQNLYNHGNNTTRNAWATREGRPGQNLRGTRDGVAGKELRGAQDRTPGKNISGTQDRSARPMG